LISVAVAGALAAKSGSGGEAWVRLSYALGLRRLGCDVRLIEEISGASPDAVEYARAAAAAFGLEYMPVNGDLSEGGDLLLNISGNVRSQAVRRRFRRSAFVDVDPGFTQRWHEQGLARVDGHDAYFTIASSLGTRRCAIPTCGLDWRPTRPPLVLEEWPVVAGGFDRFTTVATWRPPFGRIDSFGLKNHEWRKFLTLPGKTGLPFEAALRIDPADEADRVALQNQGWRLVAPQVASDPADFRRYVQTSGAEFSVAQGIYVETKSGWFSDRSVRYLASGRPVLIEDTGFGQTLPVGEGLLTFRTLEDAAMGARAIAEDYERHARTARRLAEAFFDSDLVLRLLLEDVL
jgi:hypothetical protein